jgi:hypothetical protein
VVAWLQDDVLQRLLPPKGLRKGPKRRVRRPSQSELAMEGPRSTPRSKRAGAGTGARARTRTGTGTRTGASASAGAGCLDAVDTVSSSLDSEDLEGSNSLRFLTVKTVQVYIAAIAKIYHTQVSLGLNTHPNFRGTALKSLMKDLARTQARKRQDAFENHRAKGANSGYTTEQFLHLQDQLLSSTLSSAQVSLYAFYITQICPNCGP